MAKKTTMKVDADLFVAGEDEFPEELVQRAEAAGSITTPGRAVSVQTLKKGAMENVPAENNSSSTVKSVFQETSSEKTPPMSDDALVSKSEKNNKLEASPRRKAAREKGRDSIIMYNIPKDLYLDFMTCFHNCRHLYKTQSDVFEHMITSFINEIRPTLGSFYDNARKCEQLDYEDKLANGKKGRKGR